MVLKYYNYDVVLAEVPDEVTLAINITNCPCHCPGCHSAFLSEDIGEELTTERLSEIIKSHAGITCIAFMGGDIAPDEIVKLAKFVHDTTKLKVAWYSGRDELADATCRHFRDFDYIKLGHYDAEKGPLDKRTTNQRMYRVQHEKKYDALEDITSKFWKL